MWGRLHSKFLDVPSAELVSAEHVIGRGQHCHTKLPNDRCVSNKHCCVGRDVAAGCSTLTDTSTNGTYLNKKKVGKGKVVPLQSGDVITVLLSTNTEISFVFKAVDSGGPLDGSSGPCKQQKSTPQRTRCGSGSGDEGRRRLRSSAAVEQRHGSHCVDAPSEPGETPSRRHSAAGHAEAATGRSTDLTAQYTIVRTLGTGTFAEVKLAVDKRTGEEVAIKIIAKKTLSSPKAAATSAANMWREVDILKQLSHEGIVGVRDVFDAPDSLSLVLDLARGGELFDLIRERQYFSEAEAKTIFRQLGRAVQYLHARGIAHRDLKPENILLAEPGDIRTIRLSDFGLAKMFSQSVMATMCGTPMYVAPEVLEKAHRADQAGYTKMVDLWSLGVILYILLCGRPPFPRRKDAAGRPSKRLDYTAPLRMVGPAWAAVSEAAQDLVRRLLQCDPQRRLTIAEAMAHEWLRDEPAPEGPAPDGPGPAQSRITRQAAKRGRSGEVGNEAGGVKRLRSDA